MSATRASSMRALKYLSAHGRQVHVRRLHMTGPAEFPSPLLLPSDRPLVNIPHDVAALRAECARRNLPTAGSVVELSGRLSNDLQSRGFSTAIEKDNKRPASTATADAVLAAPVRHFNTSRALKAVKDTSTIDFAYLPDSFDADASNAVAVRVPLLPDVNFRSPRSQVLIDEEPEPVPMRHEISTVSADTTYFHPPSALTDVTDNSSIAFDGIAESSKNHLAASESKVAGLRQFWDGFLDDVFGPKTAVAVAR